MRVGTRGPDPKSVAGRPVHRRGEPDGAGDALAPSPASAAARRMTTLNRLVGNHQLNRLIRPHVREAGGSLTAAGPRIVQRDILGDLLDLLQGITPEDRKKIDAEIATFRKKKFPALKSHKPSSGLGQFDAAFDPATGRLTVTLRVGFKFVNGKKGNVPAGFRSSEFVWKSSEAAKWKKQYMTDVGTLWSDKHKFKSTKKGWRAVTVDTTVKVVEATAKPHFIATVAKYPPDAAMVQSSICPPGTHHQGGLCMPNAGGAGHGTASLDSNDLRPEQKLDWGNATTAIPFAVNLAALNAAGTAALTPIVTAMKADAAMHVELTGHANNTRSRGQTAAEGGIVNMDLSRKRTSAVVGHLTSQGISADRIFIRNQGETGATADVAWCRVDAQTGKKQTQDPALHETGHMLGLDDEYPTPGVAAGSAMPAAYDAMIKGTTGDVVTHGRNEGAMSVGSTVQKWHYSSFLEALRTMSGMPEWGV